MAVFGSDQMTRALDLVAPDFPDVIEILYQHGFKVIVQKTPNPDGSVSYEVYKTELEARYAIGLHDRASFQTVHHESGAELDIWLRPRVPYEELRSSARPVALGGLTILVPDKEKMIRLKEAALADDPSRQSKDQWDIDFLKGKIA